VKKYKIEDKEVLENEENSDSSYDNSIHNEIEENSDSSSDNSVHDEIENLLKFKTLRTIQISDYFDLLDEYVFKPLPPEISNCKEIKIALKTRFQNLANETNLTTGNGLVCRGNGLLHRAIEMYIEEEGEKANELRFKYVSHILNTGYHNLNLKNKNEETPLGLALLQSPINLNIAEELISHGASLIDVVGGKSALHLENVLKNLSVVEYLITKLPHINLRENNTPEGHIPLYYAYKYNLLDTFKHLLEENPIFEYDLIDKSGRYNIFGLILREKKERYLDIILDNPNFNFNFFYMVKMNDERIFSDLTYFDVCIIYDNEKFAQKLISKKFALIPNIPNLNNITLKHNNETLLLNYNCIHLCVIFQRPNILKLLLDYKPDYVDIKTKKEGFTALYLAVQKSNYFIIDILLKAKANPFFVPSDTKYPPMLHISSFNGNEDIVKLLLEYKADPFEKDINGKNAFYYARISNHMNIIEILNQTFDKLPDDTADFRIEKESILTFIAFNENRHSLSKYQNNNNYIYKSNSDFIFLNSSVLFNSIFFLQKIYILIFLLIYRQIK
jgi:ankyrin repeat protein